MLQGVRESVAERLVMAMEPLADVVLQQWDAAEDRQERATLVPLLRRFMAVRAAEDRLVHDYLHSLRSGDRHVAAILQAGSERVVAAYAQVILRRMGEGRGLARYAVRHLARRGDGLGLLRGVVVSEHFAPRDVLTVLEAHPDRDLWVRALPRLARDGNLPSTNRADLAACLTHPDAVVRSLAERRWAEAGWGTPQPTSWAEACDKWLLDPRSDAEVRADAEAWGRQVVAQHGRWLHGLKRLPTQRRAPKVSQPGLQVHITQQWVDDCIVFHAAPAPLGSRPRLVVTLRGEDGLILDVFRLHPVGYDGATARFEAWRLGRRAAAVTATAELR